MGVNKFVAIGHTLDYNSNIKLCPEKNAGTMKFSVGHYQFFFLFSGRKIRNLCSIRVGGNVLDKKATKIPVQCRQS